MTNKKTAAKPAPSPAPDETTLQIHAEDYGLTKEMSQAQVKASLAGAVIGGAAQKAYSCFREQIELGDVLVEMRKAGDEAVKGDLGRVERMLMNQAITLDTIFNNLAERASRQEYIKNMDTYLRLALKAQSQARATAETLSIVKNPMPYIKQANIAQGHQQVNNGVPAPSAHAGDSSFQQSKLLGAENGQTLERMDTGTTIETIASHQTVETVGKVKRAEVARR